MSFKNILNAGKELVTYVQIPNDLKPYCEVINIYVWLSLLVALRVIKTCTFEYLRKNKIYSQENDLLL